MPEQIQTFFYQFTWKKSEKKISNLVSLLLAQESTEPVSELVTQMAVELINIHLISVQQKR